MTLVSESPALCLLSMMNTRSRYWSTSEGNSNSNNKWGGEILTSKRYGDLKVVWEQQQKWRTQAIPLDKIIKLLARWKCSMTLILDINEISSIKTVILTSLCIFLSDPCKVRIGINLLLTEIRISITSFLKRGHYARSTENKDNCTAGGGEEERESC